MKRRIFLASSIATLAGCSPIGTALNNNMDFMRVLYSAESLNQAVIGTRGLARQYPESAVDRVYRVNGFATPSDAGYTRMVADDFRSYRLRVDGAVERPVTLGLARLQAMPQRRQITRHDCVEGWSAIGEWTGVRLGDVLALARPRTDARYVVFHCLDNDGQGNAYYESLDMQQANHPQALLATTLNGAPLDPDHGAPVRLRVPTQLGYKSAKWVARLELVGSYANIEGGHGGYWEDQGYEWYAGI